MSKTPRSFIREILKVTERPEIISFAGGLPNPSLFPVHELAKSAERVIQEEGKIALQYSTTEGYLPLREFIAERYKKRCGFSVSPDEILITNGSQQCLDLIGKILINAGDPVAIERPGYLGAIQAFSMYEPEFRSVPLKNDGPDGEVLTNLIKKESPVLFYGVQNSQNPSGITWSAENRKEVVDALEGSDTILVEDDAYGELRFSGETLPLMRSYLPDQTILTGSFSKIISPGMRMGWICASPEIISQITTVKQGTDLHSNYLSQRIIYQYLTDYRLDDQIPRINKVYLAQKNCMIQAIQHYFPDSVTYTNPEGGMFLWVTIPDGYSSMDLFDRALQQNVAILPGKPFYTDDGGDTTMRLNYSNAGEEMITEGIRKMGSVLDAYLA